MVFTLALADEPGGKVAVFDDDRLREIDSEPSELIMVYLTKLSKLERRDKETARSLGYG